MKTQPFRRQGFTLVEIMICVIIFGLLASLAIPTFQRAHEESKVERQVEAAGILTKAVIYKAERVIGATGTRYYLLAADGTGIEVKLSEFARINVGDPVKSAHWQNVD